MALPSSPPINYLQILAEFGAPAGTPITAMVRGGAYVPNTAQNAGVPTAPPIDVLDFLGASAVVPPTVELDGGSIGSFTLSPDDSSITLSISPDGTLKQSQNFAASTSFETWLLSGSASAWDVRATLLSGALSSGTTGVWANCGGTSAWTVQRTSNVVGSNTATIRLELRPAGGGAVAAAGDYTLTATVDS